MRYIRAACKSKIPTVDGRRDFGEKQQFNAAVERCCSVDDLQQLDTAVDELSQCLALEQTGSSGKPAAWLKRNS